MERPSPTPPTPTTRPKTSSSSIASSNANPASGTQQAATSNMPSSSRTARGSTPTTTRPTSKAADPDKPTRPSSKDSLKQKLLKKSEEIPKPSRSEEQLRTLKSDFDGLRSHLTCKICDRLLYQPYTIACGHTYCYSCLCTWFVNNKARKTCPDCRTLVTQLPAPAYIIRDMTIVFISRTELLPPGETVEQHAKWQKEEADVVQQDKDNQDPRTGGLFKGVFRASRQPAPSLRVIRDEEDGVDRCPMCAFELEDGECASCGLFLDDNGELTWGESFTGFSDMDELSERDLSGEDLDADMDIEDGFDGYDDNMDAWQDYLGDESSYMMRRFLEHGIPPQAFRQPRRRMTHSEAGSRRSYSQSIVSDMYTDEMDTVEEEDEDGLDGDSSMNDFLDDEEPESNSTSASSTPAPTSQPSNNRARAQGRARRVVESEASSTVSNVIEEEEEEDAGPIRRGQRNRAQTRILSRANGEPTGPPSSTSTENSGEQELDEDTQALLQSEGWMLQHAGPDEEMEDEDDDSDGGRTTVGWDATAISNDRFRMGGSLTPTADRPRPNAPIRPPSRAGNLRFMDASRGLRRRSSVLSNSTMNYEDGEADDDDSDLDQDGDINMAMNSLRSRRSRTLMRAPTSLNTNNGNVNNRFANRGFSQDNAIDLEADDSDNSQPGNGRTRPRIRRQEYNPRISWMFADHQRALEEFQRGGPLLDLDPRSTTPVARPRTANRNRPSPAQQFSPFMPPAPARMRTPQMDNTSNMVMGAHGPISPPRRPSNPDNTPAATGTQSSFPVERAPSISSTSDASTILTPGTSTGTSTPILHQSVNAISQAQAAAAMDMIDRPPSRISARPPSTTGRRNSAGFSPVYPVFPQNTVGLNMQSRILQAQGRGNPWGAFVQPHGVRTRTSRPALRDQSSIATLRAANSRANIRDGANPQQGMRSQASRIDLRAQPSRRRLNNQASTRTLRASEHARPPQSPTTNAGVTNQPTSRPTRLTPDERNSLARELINDRMRALGNNQAGANPARTNPFFRRPPLPADAPAPMTASNASQHIRSNSNESVNSIVSSHTAQAAPSSPGLSRRRSNRNIASAPPPGVTSPSQGGFVSQTSNYANNYFRARQGSLTGGSPAYESPLNSNTRAAPMVAASGPLI